jgi:hypothetical protein
MESKELIEEEYQRKVKNDTAQIFKNIGEQIDLICATYNNSFDAQLDIYINLTTLLLSCAYFCLRRRVGEEHFNIEANHVTNEIIEEALRISKLDLEVKKQ